ncbi:MAG: alpha/beta hydrolase-fold protein [bacterium]
MIIFLLGVLALLAIGCTQRDNPTLPERPLAGTIVQATHQYNGLTGLQDPDRSRHAARRVFAYLPSGYRLDIVGQRYPVLYLLPGYDGEASFEYSYGNENYYMLANIAVIADRLIADGEIKPMIIVLPDASIPYGGAFYGDSELDGPWEDMMARELVDYVDATYLTLVDQADYEDKDFRAIAGHASGGYGAMRLAMDYPDQYNSVSAIDAPLAFSELPQLFGDYLTESNITSSASYFATDTTGMRSQPYKILLLSMAATFSPSGVKDETTKFGKLQIGLPFDYEGNTIDTIWSKWMDNDLYSWLDLPDYQAALSGQHIYFESATSDIGLTGFNAQTEIFQQRLTQLGIAYSSATYSGYEGYDARSRSFLYDRLEYILKFHDQYLRDRFGQF